MENVYRDEEHEYDNLVLMGQMPVVTDTIRLCSGTWKRGMVIGINAGTGEGCLVDKDKDDGTQIPYAVMSESGNSATPFDGAVYLTGEFKVSGLIVGSGTIEDYKKEMRKIGLFVRNTQRRY